MRIAALEIKNYRNIKCARAESLPNMIFLSGANGSGKSSILEAIYLTKEAASSGTQAFLNLKNVVAADSSSATVTLTLEFNSQDITFAQTHLNFSCPTTQDIRVIFRAGEKLPICDCPDPVRKLLGVFSLDSGAPGYLDFFSASRRIQEQRLNNLELVIPLEAVRSSLADENQKFLLTKRFIVHAKLKDLQRFKEMTEQRLSTSGGPIEEIQRLFKRFFDSMTFKDVEFRQDAVRFLVQTASGEVDIDELSSGEREVLHVALRFMFLRPRGSIILFDEPDAHLHPYLAKKYASYLYELSETNQIWAATHSPDMLLSTPPDSWYIVMKNITSGESSQMVRIVSDGQKHSALTELMGTSGLVAIHRKVIFIEGESASLDRDVFEKFFSPSEWNVEFVPSARSRIVIGIADKVQALLSTPTGFHEYYCIVDGDSVSPTAHQEKGSRLYRLPVYHIENYLLRPDLLLASATELLRGKSPYKTVSDVEDALKHVVSSQMHVSALARARLDAAIQDVAAIARSNILSRTEPPLFPTYEEVEKKAYSEVQKSIEDGTWDKICKGRDVLRAIAGNLQIKYDHLRNSILSKLTSAPADLTTIMDQIGAQKIEDPPAYPATSGWKMATEKSPYINQLSPTASVFFSGPSGMQSDEYKFHDGTIDVPGGRISVTNGHISVAGAPLERNTVIQGKLQKFFESREAVDLWNRVIAGEGEQGSIHQALMTDFCQRCGFTP